ncbi:hypothetical protein Droror1_Dr00006684 [Drosera rotundifolia]
MPPLLPSPSYHLRSLLTSLTQPDHHHRLLIHHLSSSAAAAAWGPRNRPANVFEADPTADYSERYRHKIKYTRPSTLSKWILRPHLINSASFIGTVELPPKVVGTRTGSFGVYTMLRVSTSSTARRSFSWICVKFWGELADTAFEHLKADDFIYVSGSLHSYEKDFPDGKNKTFYEVKVRELNYVKQHATVQKVDQSKSADVPGESWSEKNRCRLHLWQIFFANPFEWYDIRRRKENPKQPDFRNKHTREALWLKDNDPPWVKKQLQLHDSRIALRSTDDSYY